MKLNSITAIRALHTELIAEIWNVDKPFYGGSSATSFAQVGPRWYFCSVWKF